MMTPIHAGSEDYFKQLNGLKFLPSDEHTLGYLKQLIDNPNSPFEQFLVGGKISQIEKDLAAQKGMQAQAQVGGGLPTIKDKLIQSSSLLAAQNAMQGKGQMPSPAMPASSAAVSPEEEMQMSGGQPEETMDAAHGGIMNVPLHDDTFSFAPGGIVAFNGKDGDQKVEDSKYKPLPSKTESTASALFNALGLDKLQNFISENAARDKMTQQAQYDQKPGVFEKLTPTERQARLDAMNSTISGATQGLQGRLVTDPDEKAKLEMIRTGINSTPVNRQLGDPSIPRDQIPVMPGPDNNIVGSRRNMDQIMAEQAALQAAKTKPIVSNAPSSARPAGDAEGLKMIKDALSKQNIAIDKYTSEIPKDKSIEDMVKDIRDTDLASGVGSYEKWAKENFKEKQRRYDKQTEGRGRQDAMAQLAAYSRPGARWSDVLERDIQNKAKHLEEDKQFQTLQDNYEDSIYKMAEERSVGNAKDLRAAMKDQKTTKATMLQHIMTAYNVPLQVAERMWSTQAQVAEQARGHDLQHKVGMAQAAATAYRSDAADRRNDILQQSADTSRISTLLRSDATYKKYSEQVPKLQQALNNKDLSEKYKETVASQLRTAQDYINRKNQDVGVTGGIASVNPAPAATTSNVPPRPPNAVQLMPK